MKSQFIDLQTAYGICDCYFVQPESEGRYPGVLLLMDAFGPRAYLYELANKLATNGYLVLLPNIFYRNKRAPVVSVAFPIGKESFPLAIAEVMPLARGYQVEPGLDDIGIFLDFLKKQNVCSGKMAVSGYCMGGSLAIRTAARYADQIAAVASFHAGNLATEVQESPHLLLTKIKAELYVAHADNDQSMPLGQIMKFQEAIESSHVKAHAEVYQGAAHGFTMGDLPAFNPEALAKHWLKLLDLLKRNLSN